MNPCTPREAPTSPPTLDPASVRLQSLADRLPALVAFVDREQRYRFVNRSYERWYGVPLDQVRGRTMRDVMGEEIYALLRPAAERALCGEHVSQEIDLSTTRLARWTHGDFVPCFDERGAVRGFWIWRYDVTQYKSAVQSLTHEKALAERSASLDALTGLPNRREFERALAAAIPSARAGARTHALLYIDLDQFKVVNDTCGHLAGDELLREAARAIGPRLRESDLLARLGGDEFGVLLHGCPPAQAKRIAESIVEAVGALRFAWRGKRFGVGASIGIATLTEDTAGSEDALSRADAACFFAKELGRNRVQIYRADDGEVSRRHGDMHWVSRLHHALDEGRFTLHLQQIAVIGPHAVREPWHFEVLLRLNDEEGQLVSPGSFLPAAEHYSLMPILDRWVVETLFRALSNGAPAGRARFAVNLSGATLNDPLFLAFVLRQMDLWRIDPRILCFEITETVAVANLALAIEFITALRQRGCSFALDDFGSGLSSFGYLKNLPVDTLKIDGGLVRHIAFDAVDRAMVEAIHSVGRAMGIRTVAESVESSEVLAELARIGVGYAQGYGIHRPEPLDGVLASLGAGR